MPTKILIVEDEAITAMDIKNRLNNLGLDVVGVASRGKEAIDKAGEFKPDLILMDITLKGDMDGIEAAEEINALFNIPVIYMSAFTDENTFKRIKLTNPYGFVNKPVSSELLMVSIEAAVYKHDLDKKLAESEEKYRTLYESLRDAFASVNMEGQIIEFNDVFREMLGYTEEELHNLEYVNLTPGKWHKMESDIINNHVIPRGFSNVYEKEYIRKDGTIFPVELKAFLIRNQVGNPISMWAIIRDITERKKAEEKLKQAHKNLEVKVEERTKELNEAYKLLKESEENYRELVESARNIILKMDINGYITFFNEYAEEFFGFKRNEIIGKNVIGTIVPETESSGRDLKKMVDKILKNPNLHEYNENENITKHGKRVWILWSNKGIYNKKGELINILSVGTDTNKRKEAEKIR